MDPAPWVRSGGPVGQPPQAGAFGRSPGSRGDPWALFGYFLSQQKVTPRRGGETRQKTFRTRQDCEGPDHRVAVKRKRRCKTKPANPRKKSKPPEKPVPPGRPFKKRPFGPVLKGRQTNSQAPGAPRGWVTVSLVPAADCHFAQTQKRKDSSAIFSIAPGF